MRMDRQTDIHALTHTLTHVRDEASSPFLQF